MIKHPVIRRHQIRALAAASMSKFYDDLAAHVARVFPRHAVMVRGDHGRKFMESCVLRAAAYNIRGARSIAMFTDLVIALGQEFDVRPEHAWIRELLESGLGDAGKLYLIYKQLPDKCPGPPAPVPAWATEESEEAARARAGRPPILVRAVGSV